MNSSLTDFDDQVESGTNCERGRNYFSSGYFLSFISNKIKVLVALYLGLLFFWGNIAAQTDFAPGDIMFTGFDSDDADAFNIVLLTDVVANTTIYITDRGWDNASGDGFRDDTNGGEGTISFQFTSDYTCGTEFFFTDVDGAKDWECRDAAGPLVGIVTILTNTSESSGQDGDGPELACANGGFGCPDG